MSANDCIEAISNAFRERKTLSEAEIKFIAEELRRRFKRSRESAGHEESWNQVATELASDIKETAFIERRNAALNVAAKQRLMAMAEEADKKYNDPKLGLEAAMVGINKPIAGGRLSVDASSLALFRQYVGGLISELEREGLIPHLNEGSIDIEIARALEKLTRPEAAGTDNKFAEAIAAIIHKWRKVALDRQNRAGSWVKQLSGYITSQNWDMAKLRKAGYETWRDFVLPLLDEERTFGDADPDKFLREAYRTLVNGENLSANGADIDLALAFKGPANLGKRLSQHRVLHFKNADAWAAANERFGTKSLREAILSEFMSLSRNTALMETFGPNPRALFDDVLTALREKFSDDPAKVDKLRGRLLQAYMDEVSGHSRVAASPTVAAISRNVRAVTSMAKLGGSVISSLTDIAAKAAQIRYMDGGGILSPFAKAFSTFFEGLAKGQRKEIADRIAVGVEGMLGSVAERFGAVDAQEGVMSRAMRAYFKLNLLTPWTEANKRGLAMFASRSLAAHAATAFDKLPEHMRFILEQYGIDAPRWELMRGLTEYVEGRTYLLPDRIAEIPADEFTKRGLDPVKDRDAIETALHTYLVDVTEFGVPTPGARERAMLTLGFRPGTVEGEALRFLTQFKSFPLTIATKTFGRAIYGNVSGKADKLGLAMFIASSTILGYLAMSLKSLALGLTPRDPLDRKTIFAAMAQGGGFGIYGDFLFGEYDRFGRSLTSDLAGPVLGSIDDIAELWSRIRNGDDVAAFALRTAINQAPFINLFYTRTAFDYLILFQLQEMANPGYLRRMEQHLAKDQGQRYLLPVPSSTIPRGGGNRIFEGVR